MTTTTPRPRRRLRVAALTGAAVLAVGVLGPGSPALGTSPAPERVAAAPAGATGVRIGGAVTTTGPVTRDQLEALPQRTLRLTYTSGGVPETHTFRGPLLSDVLALAAPTYDPENKNDLLRFVVLATATDGYAAAVSMGEISPDFGATPVLLALRQDGQALERPRLAVRGDVRGGRYVTDVKTLRVVRLG